MNPSTRNPGFQPLVYRGLHPRQDYKAQGVITHSAGPEDDGMRICLDLKGSELPFKEGDIIGEINPGTGVVNFNERFKEATTGTKCLSDDILTPNVEHSSVVDEIMQMQAKEKPKHSFFRVNAKKKHRPKGH